MTTSSAVDLSVPTVDSPLLAGPANSILSASSTEGPEPHRELQDSSQPQVLDLSSSTSQLPSQSGSLLPVNVECVTQNEEPVMEIVENEPMETNENIFAANSSATSCRHVTEDDVRQLADASQGTPGLPENTGVHLNQTDSSPQIPVIIPDSKTVGKDRSASKSAEPPNGCLETRNDLNSTPSGPSTASAEMEQGGDVVQQEPSNGAVVIKQFEQQNEQLEIKTTEQPDSKLDEAQIKPDKVDDGQSESLSMDDAGKEETKSKSRDNLPESGETALLSDKHNVENTNKSRLMEIAQHLRCWDVVKQGSSVKKNPDVLTFELNKVEPEEMDNDPHAEAGSSRDALLAKIATEGKALEQQSASKSIEKGHLEKESAGLLSDNIELNGVDQYASKANMDGIEECEPVPQVFGVIDKIYCGQISNGLNQAAGGVSKICQTKPAVVEKRDLSYNNENKGEDDEKDSMSIGTMDTEMISSQESACSTDTWAGGDGPVFVKPKLPAQVSLSSVEECPSDSGETASMASDADGESDDTLSGQKVVSGPNRSVQADTDDELDMQSTADDTLSVIESDGERIPSYHGHDEMSAETDAEQDAINQRNSDDTLSHIEGDDLNFEKRGDLQESSEETDHDLDISLKDNSTISANGVETEHEDDQLQICQDSMQESNKASNVAQVTEDDIYYTDDSSHATSSPGPTLKTTEGVIRSCEDVAEEEKMDICEYNSGTVAHKPMGLKTNENFDMNEHKENFSHTENDSNMHQLSTVQVDIDDTESVKDIIRGAYQNCDPVPVRNEITNSVEADKYELTPHITSELVPMEMHTDTSKESQIVSGEKQSPEAEQVHDQEGDRDFAERATEASPNSDQNHIQERIPVLDIDKSSNTVCADILEQVIDIVTYQAMDAAGKEHLASGPTDSLPVLVENKLKKCDIIEDIENNNGSNDLQQDEVQGDYVINVTEEETMNIEVDNVECTATEITEIGCCNISDIGATSAGEAFKEQRTSDTVVAVSTDRQMDETQHLKCELAEEMENTISVVDTAITSKKSSSAEIQCAMTSDPAECEGDVFSDEVSPGEQDPEHSLLKVAPVTGSTAEMQCSTVPAEGEVDTLTASGSGDVEPEQDVDAGAPCQEVMVDESQDLNHDENEMEGVNDEDEDLHLSLELTQVPGTYFAALGRDDDKGTDYKEDIYGSDVGLSLPSSSPVNDFTMQSCSPTKAHQLASILVKEGSLPSNLEENSTTNMADAEDLVGVNGEQYSEKERSNQEQEIETDEVEASPEPGNEQTVQDILADSTSCSEKLNDITVGFPSVQPEKHNQTSGNMTDKQEKPVKTVVDSADSREVAFTDRAQEDVTIPLSEHEVSTFGEVDSESGISTEVMTSCKSDDNMRVLTKDPDGSQAVRSDDTSQSSGVAAEELVDVCDNINMSAEERDGNVNEAAVQPHVEGSSEGMEGANLTSEYQRSESTDIFVRNPILAVEILATGEPQGVDPIVYHTEDADEHPAANSGETMETLVTEEPRGVDSLGDHIEDTGEHPEGISEEAMEVLAKEEPQRVDPVIDQIENISEHIVANSEENIMNMETLVTDESQEVNSVGDDLEDTGEHPTANSEETMETLVTDESREVNSVGDDIEDTGEHPSANHEGTMETVATEVPLEVDSIGDHMEDAGEHPAANSEGTMETLTTEEPRRVNLVGDHIEDGGEHSARNSEGTMEALATEEIGEVDYIGGDHIEDTGEHPAANSEGTIEALEETWGVDAVGDHIEDTGEHPAANSEDTTETLATEEPQGVNSVGDYIEDTGEHPAGNIEETTEALAKEEPQSVDPVVDHMEDISEHLVASREETMEILITDESREVNSVGDDMEDTGEHPTANRKRTTKTVVTEEPLEVSSVGDHIEDTGEHPAANSEGTTETLTTEKPRGVNLVAEDIEDAGEHPADNTDGMTETVTSEEPREVDSLGGYTEHAGEHPAANNEETMETLVTEEPMGVDYVGDHIEDAGEHPTANSEGTTGMEAGNAEEETEEPPKMSVSVAPHVSPASKDASGCGGKESSIVTPNTDHLSKEMIAEEATAAIDDKVNLESVVDVTCMEKEIQSTNTVSPVIPTDKSSKTVCADLLEQVIDVVTHQAMDDASGKGHLCMTSVSADSLVVLRENNQKKCDIIEDIEYNNDSHDLQQDEVQVDYVINATEEKIVNIEVDNVECTTTDIKEIGHCKISDTVATPAREASKEQPASDTVVAVSRDRQMDEAQHLNRELAEKIENSVSVVDTATTSEKSSSVEIPCAMTSDPAECDADVFSDEVSPGEQEEGELEGRLMEEAPVIEMECSAVSVECETDVLTARGSGNMEPEQRVDVEVPSETVTAVSRNTEVDDLNCDVNEVEGVDDDDDDLHLSLELTQVPGTDTAAHGRDDDEAAYKGVCGSDVELSLNSSSPVKDFTMQSCSPTKAHQPESSLVKEAILPSDLEDNSATDMADAEGVVDGNEEQNSEMERRNQEREIETDKVEASPEPGDEQTVQDVLADSTSCSEKLNDITVGSPSVQTEEHKQKSETMADKQQNSVRIVVASTDRAQKDVAIPLLKHEVSSIDEVDSESGISTEVMTSCKSDDNMRVLTKDPDGSQAVRSDDTSQSSGVAAEELVDVCDNINMSAEERDGNVNEAAVQPHVEGSSEGMEGANLTYEDQQSESTDKSVRNQVPTVETVVTDEPQRVDSVSDHVGDAGEHPAANCEGMTKTVATEEPLEVDFVGNDLEDAGEYPAANSEEMTATVATEEPQEVDSVGDHIENDDEHPAANSEGTTGMGMTKTVATEEPLEVDSVGDDIEDTGEHPAANSEEMTETLATEEPRELDSVGDDIEDTGEHPAANSEEMTETLATEEPRELDSVGDDIEDTGEHPAANSEEMTETLATEEPRELDSVGDEIEDTGEHPAANSEGTTGMGAGNAEEETEQEQLIKMSASVAPPLNKQKKCNIIENIENHNGSHDLVEQDEAQDGHVINVMEENTVNIEVYNAECTATEIKEMEHCNISDIEATSAGEAFKQQPTSNTVAAVSTDRQMDEAQHLNCELSEEMENTVSVVDATTASKRSSFDEVPCVMTSDPADCETDVPSDEVSPGEQEERELEDSSLEVAPVTGSAAEMECPTVPTEDEVNMLKASGSGDVELEQDFDAAPCQEVVEGVDDDDDLHLSLELTQVPGTDSAAHGKDDDEEAAHKEGVCGSDVELSLPSSSPINDFAMQSSSLTKTYQSASILVKEASLSSSMSETTGQRLVGASSEGIEGANITSEDQQKEATSTSVRNQVLTVEIEATDKPQGVDHVGDHKEDTGEYPVTNSEETTEALAPEEPQEVNSVDDIEDSGEHPATNSEETTEALTTQEPREVDFVEGDIEGTGEHPSANGKETTETLATEEPREVDVVEGDIEGTGEHSAANSEGTTETLTREEPQEVDSVGDDIEDAGEHTAANSEETTETLATEEPREVDSVEGDIEDTGEHTAANSEETTETLVTKEPQEVASIEGDMEDTGEHTAANSEERVETVATEEPQEVDSVEGDIEDAGEHTAANSEGMTGMEAGNAEKETEQEQSEKTISASVAPCLQPASEDMSGCDGKESPIVAPKVNQVSKQMIAAAESTAAIDDKVNSKCVVDVTSEEVEIQSTSTVSAVIPWDVVCPVSEEVTPVDPTDDNPTDGEPAVDKSLPADVTHGREKMTPSTATLHQPIMNETLGSNLPRAPHVRHPSLSSRPPVTRAVYASPDPDPYDSEDHQFSDAESDDEDVIPSSYPRRDSQSLRTKPAPGVAATAGFRPITPPISMVPVGANRSPRSAFKTRINVPERTSPGPGRSLHLTERPASPLSLCKVLIPRASPPMRNSQPVKRKAEDVLETSKRAKEAEKPMKLVTKRKASADIEDEEVKRRRENSISDGEVHAALDDNPTVVSKVAAHVDGDAADGAQKTESSSAECAGGGSKRRLSSDGSMEAKRWRAEEDITTEADDEPVMNLSSQENKEDCGNQVTAAGEPSSQCGSVAGVVEVQCQSSSPDRESTDMDAVMTDPPGGGNSDQQLCGVPSHPGPEELVESDLEEGSLQLYLEASQCPGTQPHNIDTVETSETRYTNAFHSPKDDLAVPLSQTGGQCVHLSQTGEECTELLSQNDPVSSGRTHVTSPTVTSQGLLTDEDSLGCAPLEDDPASPGVDTVTSVVKVITVRGVIEESKCENPDSPKQSQPGVCEKNVADFVYEEDIHTGTMEQMACDGKEGDVTESEELYDANTQLVQDPDDALLECNDKVDTGSSDVSECPREKSSTTTVQQPEAASEAVSQSQQSSVSDGWETELPASLGCDVEVVSVEDLEEEEATVMEDGLEDLETQEFFSEEEGYLETSLEDDARKCAGPMSADASLEDEPSPRTSTASLPGSSLRETDKLSSSRSKKPAQGLVDTAPTLPGKGSAYCTD